MGRLPRAAILTGGKGIGKTTLCLKLAEDRSRFTGLVSPPLLDGQGRKVGFSALCLSTGEQWDLGRSDVRLEGPVYRKYFFSADGIARALCCLREALGRRDAVVIVDEIGPLEMERSEGFFPILSFLAGSSDILLVTRPRFASRLAQMLPDPRLEVLEATASTRDETERRILQFFADIR